MPNKNHTTHKPARIIVVNNKSVRVCHCGFESTMNSAGWGEWLEPNIYSDYVLEVVKTFTVNVDAAAQYVIDRIKASYNSGRRDGRTLSEKIAHYTQEYFIWYIDYARYSRESTNGLREMIRTEVEKILIGCF